VRTLLPHPLRRLIGLFAAAIILVGFTASPDVALPQPIGKLSDYGAVLDRHGRERIEALIDEARQRFGVDVFLLASWENPLPDARALAETLFRSWGLTDRGATILVVFVRADGTWTHAVVGSSDLAARGVPPSLEAGIADLVHHQRIEEAMVRLFDLIPGRLEPVGEEGGRGVGSGPRLGWLVPVILLVAASLVWGIHRRIGPRCGRILRVSTDRSALGTAGGSDRVYFCRSCGFRREGRRRPRRRT
jgi:hypothetical protein